MLPKNITYKPIFRVKKKRKAESDAVSHKDDPKPQKKKVAEANDDDLPQRRRTRSLSNAEEVYPTGQSTAEFHREHQITVTAQSSSGAGPFVCPQPMTTFASTPFSLPIRRALDAAGFPNPTPTQAQSWPIALDGRDVITVAKTGSGKTCGFLLPAFHRLLENKDRKRGPPGILVLAPTRELACQIEEECVKFGRSSNIRSTCAYGGAPKSLQSKYRPCCAPLRCMDPTESANLTFHYVSLFTVRKIQGGLEVLIATPGRLNDLLEMNVVNLGTVMFLVLDEADRM
jgi:ATP-dependent RNA helicase DDX5/DBP2